MRGYYIGIMTGTSLDAIDLCVASFEPEFKCIRYAQFPFPEEVQQELHAVIRQESYPVGKIAELDARLGEIFAACVKRLLQETGIKAQNCRAIGLHGQTVYHNTKPPHTTSWQLGDAHKLQALTQIPVIADFRRTSIALGQEGAPLAPFFLDWLAHNKKLNRPLGFLNIGGIANICILYEESFVAYDTGPGMCLLDENYRQQHQQEHSCEEFDRDGKWAASGTPDFALVEKILEDPYFQKVGNKSTGREYFNFTWLKAHLAQFPEIAKNDLQASLLELGAESIAQAIRGAKQNLPLLLGYGGGFRNKQLVQSLQAKCPETQIASVREMLQLDEQAIEALAFGYLAYCNDCGIRLSLEQASPAHIFGIRFDSGSALKYSQ